MASSTRLLLLGAAFLPMLWLWGEAHASLLDLNAEETGNLLSLPSEYLVGDLPDRPLGPFDRFWWSDLFSKHGSKTNGQKHHAKWKPVRLVTCQWTVVHEDDYAAESPSGADRGSSGGGGGGSRTRQWDQLLSSPTPTANQAESYESPPNPPGSSNRYSYRAEAASVATPLPPSLVLFGSGLAGLIAVRRKHAFFRNS